MLWIALWGNMLAHADGVQQADDGLAAASAPSVPASPVLNHAFVHLQDGRVLAAGGKASSYLEPSHELGEASEIWDPQTGQWHTLGDDLSFRESQSVSLNQLADGRVLLFAADDEAGKAQYQARIWDPRTEAVENLPLTIKARRGSDVVVLTDGSVLIINGNEGAADVWDSRSNRLVHNEVSEIENSRWKGVQLINGQVLLVEAYPADGSVPRQGIKNSICLLWNPKKGEWAKLADFPATLRDNSFLQALEEGQAHAEVDGAAYQFSLRDRTWKEANSLIPNQARAPVVAAAKAGNGAASAVAPVATQPQPARIGAVANTDGGLFGDIDQLLIRLQYAALAVAIPILMYGVVWLKQLGVRREGHGLAAKLYPIVLVALVLYVAWIVYWMYQNGL